ncbi:MAG: AraC family transcriptional regulator [Chthoniobacteraceae bacterium]
MEKKLWRDLVRPDEWYHLARFRFLPGRRASLHTHDFPEIFWVETGRARHSINGMDKNLDPGDLIFVRAADRHVLASVDAAGFMLVNLAFSPKVLADLLARHRRDLISFHDRSTPLPARMRLSTLQLKILGGEITTLACASRQRLALERFLLGLYSMFQSVSHAESRLLPEWLTRAFELIPDVSYFSEGAAGLARAAGRSPEHVARVMRARLDCTPGEYVNRIRMEHAARELKLSSRPIADIALECGIQDLSHFYALFRATFRQTPRRYRMAHQF